jgi:hypothetical protein
MADPFGTLPPEIALEQQRLTRQQQLASALLQNNQQPQGQMISGRYVAPSIFQSLQPVANMLTGAYLSNKADEQALKVAQNLRDYKTMENKAVSEAVKAKDWNKVLDLASQSYTGAGKEYVPSAIAAINPKPTELKQNYQDWLESGGKGTLLDYQRYAANLKAEHPSYTPVDTAQGMFTINSRTGQIAPVMMNGQQVMGNKGNLPEGATKQVTGATNLKDAITNYQNTLKGFSTLDMVNPDARATMGNAYNNMMLQAKEAYNLGVLNGPDYAILQSVVKDPTKLNALLVSKEALQNQATDLSKQADRIIENVYKTHNRAVPANMMTPAAPANAPKAPMSFASEADAARAGLPNGTPIVINGVAGTWRN